MTSGIYGITNKINGKKYIGKAKNIEDRWKDHTYKSRWKRFPNKTLYRAFQKYGIENFAFEIIEECEESVQNERERYWIAYYNSKKNGYNETDGGDGGETYNMRERWGLLTEDDVKYIRQRYLDCNITMKDLYEEDFKDKISYRGFTAIWFGQNWKDIMPEVYTEENKKKHIQLHRNSQGVSKRRLSIKEIQNIRERKNKGESLKSIWRKEYQNIYSYGGFRDVINKIHPDEKENQ